MSQLPHRSGTLLYLAGVWGPLRGVAGEPCSELLRSRTRCLYRGLWQIQRCRASHASCCMLLLVKLTASAMRAGRLLGRSSRHLEQVTCVSSSLLAAAHLNMMSPEQDGSVLSETLQLPFCPLGGNGNCDVFRDNQNFSYGSCSTFPFF